VAESNEDFGWLANVSEDDRRKLSRYSARYDRFRHLYDSEPDTDRWDWLYGLDPDVLDEFAQRRAKRLAMEAREREIAEEDQKEQRRLNRMRGLR
jgi:hypothetical protein